MTPLLECHTQATPVSFTRSGRSIFNTMAT
jgi:hypothetical protein